MDMDDGASGSGGELATGGSQVRGDNDGDGDGDDDDGDDNDDSDDDGNDDDDSDDDDSGMVRGDIDEADGEAVDEGQGNVQVQAQPSSMVLPSPSITVMVAGSCRPGTFDTGRAVGVRPVVITRTGGNGRLSNPFPMGPKGTDSVNFLGRSACIR